MCMWQIQFDLIWFLVTHDRPATILYIFNICTLQRVLYDLLYIVLGPAFGTLVFPDMATILWSLHPMDVDAALEHNSAALVKMWSIHVDDLIPVLVVTNRVGWLITWIRLQALVTVWSLMKASQYLGHPENTSLCWYHIHYQAFHTYYPDTDCKHLVVYSNFSQEWALGEAGEPVAILLQQYLTWDPLKALQECSDHITASHVSWPQYNSTWPLSHSNLLLCTLDMRWFYQIC
jgi:hypothetical protein